MSPSPFGQHQFVLAELSRLMGNALIASQCQAAPLVELDWIISGDTVVRPDLMVVCGPIPERHLEQPPSLIVEVLSDSTRQNDLGYKRQLYHREQVQTYMIIDLAPRSVVVDRRQPDGSYDTKTVVDEVAIILCDDCQISFSVASLFRD